MSECSDNIDSVKRVKHILHDDEPPTGHGLTILSTVDKQAGMSVSYTLNYKSCFNRNIPFLCLFVCFKKILFFLLGVIERWELLQARLQANSEYPGAHQEHHKLTSDLGEVMTWLDCVLPQLERLQRGKKPPSIRDMENSIRKLKVYLLYYCIFNPRCTEEDNLYIFFYFFYSKESQRTFGSYKALMIGVNLSGRYLLGGEGAEVQVLKAELQAANQKWTQACAALDAWENQLHLELLQCQVG